MSFTCPLCGMTSHHPADVENQYCGNCHQFIRDVEQLDQARPAHTPEDLERTRARLALVETRRWAQRQAIEAAQAVVEETRRLENLAPCPECHEIVEHATDCSRR